MKNVRCDFLECKHLLLRAHFKYIKHVIIVVRFEFIKVTVITSFSCPFVYTLITLLIINLSTRNIPKKMVSGL